MRILLSFSNDSRKFQLKWICKNGVDPSKCNDNSNFCYEGYKKCDGIANCPNGED